MIESNEEITEKIQTGSYYEDALEWYFKRYLYPVVERIFLAMLLIITAFLLFISIINMRALIAKNKNIPFIIKVENATDYFSFIKPLADKSETTQEAVAKYLIADYIKTREEYLYQYMRGKKLKYKLKKIKSSSSKSVLNEYKGYMNELNKYSPIARYRDHTNRYIQIKSFNFLGNDMTSGKVIVAFKAITKTIADDKENESLWEATVHFRLPDIETIARTGAPLRFLVKYYKARLVK